MTECTCDACGRTEPYRDAAGEWVEVHINTRRVGDKTPGVNRQFCNQTEAADFLRRQSRDVKVALA